MSVKCGVHRELRCMPHLQKPEVMKGPEVRVKSRIRKPNLYSVAVLSVALLAALAVLTLRGGEAGLRWGSVLLAVYFGLTVVLLLFAFRMQLLYNLYSYNTILYVGFALFVLSLFGTFLWAAFESFRNPDSFQAQEMLYTLVHSAKNYMFLTSPLLVLFSLALLVSNIALIRHEGRRFVNVLGILLALCLMLGEGLVAALDFISAFSTSHVLLLNLVVNLTAAFYLYFECMILGAAVADVIAARKVPELGQDFLLVLGCGLKKDGTPTPLLKGRLDLALAFDRRQVRETGREVLFVVSGGQGPDEVCPEAVSMRNYLMEQGIAEERILSEDKSSDTAENMRFSKLLIDEIKPDARVAFFTTNYHVFRAGLKARRIHMNAIGTGAKTRWYFWPNAAVREFVGLLTEHRGKQLAVFAGILAVYTVLTVLAYV